jgi:spore photoproduct lyase
MLQVVEKQLKTITIRYSGRSSDYIFPTLIQGCVGGCKYCYSARHSPETFYNEQKVSTNIDQIIKKVIEYPVNVVKPNQTHDKYITWDIS